MPHVQTQERSDILMVSVSTLLLSPSHHFRASCTSPGSERNPSHLPPIRDDHRADRRCTKISQIDYQKLAQLAGFNGAKSAASVWGPLKKKLLAGATGEAATPKSTKAKGAKVNTDDDAENEDESKPTTATVKKPRARKAKAAANAEEETASSPVHGGDFALIETKDGAARGLGTVYPTTDAVSSPEVEVAPKKRARKAANVAATNEDGSPVKKRVRKAKDPNAEPKPPAKRTKKAATIKEEPVDEQVSGSGLSVVPNTGNAYGSGYGDNVGQAPYSGGFTAMNKMTEEEIAADDALFGVHPSDNDDQTLPPA